MNTIIYLFLFSLYVWGAVLSYEDEIKEIFPQEKIREISEKGTEEIKNGSLKRNVRFPTENSLKAALFSKICLW